MLKKALLYGAVWLTKGHSTSRIRRAKKVLPAGGRLHIYYDESILLSTIQPAVLVADEGAYSVWNKPCGMLSQGSKWGDHSAIARWVELFGLGLNNLPSRPTFLVHRLDRATQGLILVAHSQKVCAKLADLFQTRDITKQYLANVTGQVNTVNVGERICDAVDDKVASSLILGMQYEPNDNRSCIRIQLETGRKHQIRKHLAGIGHPIIGDRLYGGNDGGEANVDQPDLQLKSCFLEFNCPLNGELKTYSI